MHAHSGLMTLQQAAERIKASKFLVISGDEQALRQLPTGNWIGGTSPYFIAQEGGVISRDLVFVNEFEDVSPTIRLYDEDSLAQVCRNAPDNGFTVLVLPAFSVCHTRFAEDAPGYEDMYVKPVVGWITGFHLEDMGKTTPKVVLGTTGEFFEQNAVALDVPLPPGQLARVDIVNLFQQGKGADITFERTGFAAENCQIDGKPANLARYLTDNQIDIRLPLVANYCGAMINVSIKSVDAKAGRVEFYAPVFPGTVYRIAHPIDDYLGAFQKALPALDSGVVFSCNCILNFLYSNLEGKRTGNMTGPITFGEVGYQLLNQTMVYLTIVTTNA